MNRANKMMMVATAIAAVFSAAQSFAATGFAAGYANQDLLLNFRQFPAGGPAGLNDVTFDLGNVNTFISTYGNQTVQINSASFSRPNAFDASLLTGAAGGNYSSLNNLRFGVTAADVTPGVIDRWATALRGPNADNTVNDSTPWNRASAFSGATSTGKIRDVGVNANNFGTQLSSTAVATVDANSTSYNTLSGGGVYSSFIGSTEGFTGNTFSPSSVVRLDFYSVLHGSGPGSYLGYFELQGDGDLFWVGKDFVSAVVPEPTTYGLLAGLGMLALTARRQLRQA